MLCRPKEIDTMQESNEQWWIAERGQRAPDIGNQEYCEYQYMRIVLAMKVRPNQGPYCDHSGASGADEARQRGTKEKHAGVTGRRPVQIAGHHDAAGHHVEREQKCDEAHIVEQDRTQKSVER